MNEQLRWLNLHGLLCFLHVLAKCWGIWKRRIICDVLTCTPGLMKQHNNRCSIITLPLSLAFGYHTLQCKKPSLPDTSASNAPIIRNKQPWQVNHGWNNSVLKHPVTHMQAHYCGYCMVCWPQSCSVQPFLDTTGKAMALLGRRPYDSQAYPWWSLLHNHSDIL